MTEIEIKKEIYKQKPTAKLYFIRKGTLYYMGFLNDNTFAIRFEVPVSDIGEADFHSEMDAKLLIRWFKIL